MKTLEISNLRKTFKLSRKQMKIEKTSNKTKVAVDNVSITTYSGEIYGLLGPNGAGKTTTLRCIATLIKPDSGTILVNGVDIKNQVEVKKNIGFLTSELKLENQMTPNYAFNYYAKFYGLNETQIKERKEQLFNRFGIDRFAEVKIGDLSTGMKQKVSIAVSLVHNPSIIIFDEPTNGLDIVTARQVTDYLIELKNEGKTVVISTHIMGLVEKICDRAQIIIDGRSIVEDSIENIKNTYNNDDLEEIFFQLFSQIHEVE